MKYVRMNNGGFIFKTREKGKIFASRLPYPGRGFNDSEFLFCNCTEKDLICGSFKVKVTRKGDTMIVPSCNSDDSCLLITLEEVGFRGRKTAYVADGGKLLKVDSGLRQVAVIALLQINSLLVFITETELVYYRWNGEKIEKEVLLLKDIDLTQFFGEEGCLKESFLSPGEIFERNLDYKDRQDLERIKREIGIIRI